MKRKIRIAVILFICSACQLAGAQNKYFKNWPEGKSPQEIGKLVATRFINTPHTNFGSKTPPSSITYPEVCAWYGALKFAEAGKDQPLEHGLYNRLLPLLGDDKKLVPKPDHVDHTIFGAIPLELYRIKKDTGLLNWGKSFADAQWQLPANATDQQRQLTAQGLSWQSRFWIDDMFMFTLIQVQAYRATGDTTYINREAREMAIYLDKLQTTNGLFYHAPDVPFYWGRGNGWIAAGMTEVLLSLPKNNPNRQRILKGYKDMMSTLLEYQSPDGTWRQLVDDPSAWPETSCTAMFAYAMISGVKNGWLDEHAYGPSARRAWLALTSYINASGDISDVCEGTNKLNDRQYYLNRKRNTGDLHGQAPVLWCAYALITKKD
jgi:unsaturated rhamnogalacturonyl hydrolase